MDALARWRDAAAVDPLAFAREMAATEERIAVGCCGPSAASSPADALRALLAEQLAGPEPQIEMQCSVGDGHLRHLFAALCARYGIEPYRKARQHSSTVMVRGPQSFLHEVLWRLFEACTAVLATHLHSWLTEAIAAFDDAPVRVT